MRSLLLCFVLFFAALPVRADLSPDVRAAITALGATHRPHPYLLFTAAEKTRMLQRIQADPREREEYAAVLLEGRRLLNAPPDHEVAPPRELHTRWVGADDYRQYVARHLQAALTLAFLYQTTGDSKYVTPAFQHADIVCAQESWVQSPHMFDVIYSRVWPWGAKDDQVVFPYDITAAGTSQAMALVYDWLYDGLTRPQRDRIRGALLEKAITRVRGNYEYLWWATAYRCNWSGICHSGLGMAALALLDDDPQLTDVVARSCEGVTAMLDHIGADGGWQEGRGYWAYGVGESVRFIDALKRVTGGRVDLFRHRALAQHPLDFALYGLTAGFCDGSGAPVGQTFFVNKLVAESGSATGAWYARHFVRGRHDLLDFIWPAPAVAPQAPTSGSKFFPSIDWAVLRRDFTAGSLTVATKAGMNDDPHHGHLDCGTFNLTWHNQSYIGEVARLPYDEQYFGALRWDYLEARTRGHNCVLVDGVEQICAKLKDQPWKEGIGGHITAYTDDPHWAAVSMNPTHAYPASALHEWLRWIILDKDTNIAVVLDRVQCRPGAAIDVLFHPGVSAFVKGDHVLLRGAPAAESDSAEGRAANPSAAQRESLAPRLGRVQLETAGDGAAPDLEMIALATSPVTLVQGRQPEVPITAKAEVHWVPYFSTSLKAPREDNVIVSVFAPASLAGSLGCTLNTAGAQPEVSYIVNGRRVTYRVAPDHIERRSE